MVTNITYCYKYSNTMKFNKQRITFCIRIIILLLCLLFLSFLLLPEQKIQDDLNYMSYMDTVVPTKTAPATTTEKSMYIAYRKEFANYISSEYKYSMTKRITHWQTQLIHSAENSNSWLPVMYSLLHPYQYEAECDDIQEVYNPDRYPPTQARLTPSWMLCREYTKKHLNATTAVCSCISRTSLYNECPMSLSLVSQCSLSLSNDFEAIGEAAINMNTNGTGQYLLAIKIVLSDYHLADVLDLDFSWIAHAKQVIVKACKVRTKADLIVYFFQLLFEHGHLLHTSYLETTDGYECWYMCFINKIWANSYSSRNSKYPPAIVGDTRVNITDISVTADLWESNHAFYVASRIVRTKRMLQDLIPSLYPEDCKDKILLGTPGENVWYMCVDGVLNPDHKREPCLIYTFLDTENVGLDMEMDLYANTSCKIHVYSGSKSLGNATVSQSPNSSSITYHEVALRNEPGERRWMSLRRYLFANGDEGEDVDYLRLDLGTRWHRSFRELSSEISLDAVRQVGISLDSPDFADLQMFASMMRHFNYRLYHTHMDIREPFTRYYLFYYNQL